MPQRAWSAKRERQYEHIKAGLEERNYKEDTAEEIAARTVNKERARSGEAKTASRASTEDISSPASSSCWRSRMTKAQLLKAVGR